MTTGDDKGDATASPATEAVDVTNGDVVANGDVMANGDVVASGEAQKFPTVQLDSIRVQVKGTEIDVVVPRSMTVQEMKQCVTDEPALCHMTCFELVHDGRALGPFVEFSAFPQLEGKKEIVLDIVEGSYNLVQARYHVQRLRDIISSKGRQPSYIATPESASVYTALTKAPISDAGEACQSTTKHATDDYSGPLVSRMFPATPEVDSLECLKRLVLSPFNPPPPSRQLMGDIFYVEVETLEGRVYHITAWTHGFYVNSSAGKVFNGTPHQSCARAHSLAGTLSLVSEKFKANFARSRDLLPQRHQCEFYPVPYPSSQWLLPKRVHTADPNRAEQVWNHDAAEVVEGGATILHDWNDEYQTFKALPRESAEQRAFRDRMVMKINSEFVEAAIKGTKAIVNKNVEAMDPLEEESTRMFIYNNIFFTYQDNDNRGTYRGGGGDRAAAMAAVNDLEGVIAFNEKDVPGICTLLTAILDYRGHRIVAQGIIPGVFLREQVESVVYGTIDNGKTIAFEATYHEHMGQVTSLLHLKEHTVKDGEGKPVQLNACIDTKGIKGTDGRQYVLDLTRLAPVDAAVLEEGNCMATIRREALEAFTVNQQWESLAKAFSKTAEKSAAAKKAAELEDKKAPEEGDKKAPEEGKKAPEEDDKKDEQPDTAAEDKAPEGKAPEGGATEAAAVQEGDGAEGTSISTPLFNPDVFLPADAAEGEEQEEQEALARKLSTFVLETIIPNFVEECARGGGSPLDGTQLMKDLEGRGVPHWHLARVARLAAKTPGAQHIEVLAIREMVTRAAAFHLNTFLRMVEPDSVAATVAHYLNCFVGRSGALGDPLADVASERRKYQQAKSKKGKKSKKKDAEEAMPPTASTTPAAPMSLPVHPGLPEPAPLTPAGEAEQEADRRRRAPLVASYHLLTSPILWRGVRAHVLAEFKYELAGDHSSPIPGFYRLGALRELCLRTGVQLAPRDYALADVDASFERKEKTVAGTCQNRPVGAEDVQDLLVRVMHTNPVSQDARDLISHAQRRLQSAGQELHGGEIAYDLLNRAFSILCTSVGLIHEDTARCCFELALVAYFLQDPKQAFLHMQKAVVIHERLHGMDSLNVFQCYKYLGVFCFAMAPREAEAARVYMSRALYIAELAYGPAAACSSSALPPHPDIVAMHVNLGHFFQEVGAPEAAVQYLGKALAMQQQWPGEDSIITASTEHSLAQSCARAHDFKAAMEHERAAFHVLSKPEHLGPEHAKTVEVAKWMAAYTHLAVEKQKTSSQLRGVADAQLAAEASNKKNKKNKNKNNKNKKKEAAADTKPGASDKVELASKNKGHLSVDELVSFITEEGSNDKKTPSGGGNKKGKKKRKGKA